MKSITITVDTLDRFTLLTKGEMTALAELLKHTQTKGQYKGYIILNKTIKTDIVNKLDMKITTLGNVLNKLKRIELLVWQDIGMYKVNDKYFKIN